MEGKYQPDERHDNLPQDDASIEILSESGDSHTRDCEWSIYSSSISSIAESEVSLMDFQQLSMHSKMATIVHRDGRQFIERRDLDDGGLPYSAEFYLNGEVWKLSGDDCLLMSPRRYIAKVTIEVPVDLDEAVGFEEAVLVLLKHLKVEKVLVNEDLEECNKAQSVLVMTLDKLADESEENIDRKRDVMLLRMLLKKHGNLLNMDFKRDLRNCSRLSSEIMSTLDNYVTKACCLIQRNEILGQLNDSSLSDELINDAIQEALNHHRARLEAICPPSMKDKLKDFPDDRIMYVTKEDMHLFTDLTTLDKAKFEAVLPKIFSKFLTSVQEIHDEQFTYHEPLNNRIFLYVCKSMQEVSEDLEFRIEINNAIMYSVAFGWGVTNLQVDSQSSHSKCLRQQLQMLAKLANHFEPGGPFRTSRFQYEFKLFQHMDAIPEPVRIWLCLLDDCMKDLVQADLDKMQMLSCFFKSYVSFVASEDFRSETLECLRTITHDALRSLADMTSSQQDRTTSDSVSSEYNQMINCFLDKVPREHFGNECDQIQTTLKQIICIAMEMNVSSDELSQFSCMLKQLLNDLSDLQLEWFIQLKPSDKRSLFLRSQFIVPVDSLWKDTEYECFKVVDLEGFVEKYKLLHNSQEIPKHYQLKMIHALLQNVLNRASKQNWTDGKRLSGKDLLDAMTDMINSIRSSLVLLKEQQDYCCFDYFLIKIGKLCSQAMKQEVQELPYTDVIDSEETLGPLLDRFVGSISKEVLMNSLQIYTTQFNKHIVESARLSREKRIEKIVSDVQSKTKVDAIFTEEFKRNELPEVLAGLSAVWSIIVSENDRSSEKMTKPSLLQISCVLTIFNNNDPQELIEISTQEGKEGALGLTAALFALYGLKVRIACFNSHLTRMNSVQWIKVFRSFSILSNISYESLHDVARDWSKGVYEKYTAYINECLGIETNSNNDNELNNDSENARSVLLIADIDIILQEYTMVGSIMRLVRPTIPGLEVVQRKLFCHNIPVDVTEIAKYIKQSDNPDIKELRKFLGRPHSYKILEGSLLQREGEYTNKTLFLKHLKAMKEAKTMRDYYSECSLPVTGSNQYGYLSVGSISFPYLHLLKTFPIVLGFASAPLDVSYTRILYGVYGITKPYRITSESNTVQTIPVKFDSKKDFLYFDAEDDWMEAIIVAIKGAIDRNCLVLVFFNDVLRMEKLQHSQRLKQLNVTAIKTASNRENLSHEIVGYEISVLMVCNGHFSKDRQVHVIQTFFSEDAKEEELIRRQAERSQSIGSYELIVTRFSSSSLTADPTKEEITYDYLVKNRRPLYVDSIIEDMTYGCSLSMHYYNKIKMFLR